MSTNMINRLIPIQIFMLALGLGGVLHGLLPGRFAAQGLLAGVLVGLALGLGAWAIAEFRRHHTQIDPRAKPSQLVTSGPYRFTRNPMYLALTGVLLGIALALGSWPLLVSPLAFWLFMNYSYIPREEQKVARVLGQPYLEYLGRVRRWI